MERLPRSFFERDTLTVARELLGTLLVHRTGEGEQVGRIVEVEAYVGQHDLASHSARGVTPRSRVMFGEPGHAYVYLVYGMHHCMNVVTEPAGKGCAVLLRALEPVSGIEASCRGPGLLARAMGIRKEEHNGLDLCSSQTLFIAAGTPVGEVARSARIGVAYAGEWATAPLRFYVPGNPHVSGKKIL